MASGFVGVRLLSGGEIRHQRASSCFWIYVFDRQAAGMSMDTSSDSGLTVEEANKLIEQLSEEEVEVCVCVWPESRTQTAIVVSDLRHQADGQTGRHRQTHRQTHRDSHTPTPPTLSLTLSHSRTLTLSHTHTHTHPLVCVAVSIGFAIFFLVVSLLPIRHGSAP